VVAKAQGGVWRWADGASYKDGSRFFFERECRAVWDAPFPPSREAYSITVPAVRGLLRCVAIP
jgi:hypothetical protein